MTADGSGQTNLTNGPFADRRPDWQPIVTSTPGPPPPPRILTVNLGGSGTGSVTGPGISCPADCTETYVNGSPVKLDAAGTGGSTFGGWGGACGGTGNCQVTMDADKAVSVGFLSPVTTRCKGVPATILGTDGKDVLTGSQGQDVIAGLRGNDKLTALAGNDLVCGGKGNDTVKGGSGKDQLSGQKGNDKLYGQKGNDKLSGKAGKDTLKGGPGKDILKGGAGKDTQVQ
jgi:Ca2+-binding RTX toxin-like protein